MFSWPATNESDIKSFMWTSPYNVFFLLWFMVSNTKIAGLSPLAETAKNLENKIADLQNAFKWKNNWRVFIECYRYKNRLLITLLKDLIVFYNTFSVMILLLLNNFYIRPVLWNSFSFCLTCYTPLCGNQQDNIFYFGQ